MVLAIIITLGIFLIGSVYTTLNLLFKTEKQEDIIQKQGEFITKLSESIGNCSARLSIIDHKGSFKSDDEIGWFFQEIQAMQNSLDQFIIKPDDGESKT